MGHHRSDMDARFASLYANHSDRVLARARSLIADPGLAEDAAQLAWERIFKAVPRIDMDDPLPLVMRLTHWAVGDTLRRHARAQRTLLADPATLAQQAVGYSDEVHDEAVRVARRMAIVDSLNRLPLSQRRVLVMHEIEGIATAEIARRRGTSDNAVRSLVKRARRQFRDDFGDLTRDGSLAGVAILRLLTRAGERCRRARVEVVCGRLGDWTRVTPDVAAALVASAVLVVGFARGPVPMPRLPAPHSNDGAEALNDPARNEARADDPLVASRPDQVGPRPPRPATGGREAAGGAGETVKPAGAGAPPLRLTTTAEKRSDRTDAEYDNWTMIPECKGVAEVPCRAVADLVLMAP